MASKKKVVYIISRVNKALAFEWIADRLNKEKLDVSFILLNPAGSELEDYLKKSSIKVYSVYYNSKKNIPYAVFRTFALLMRIRPDIIHCHLFDASIIGLIAGRLAFIKKRIYTRHHSTYHHEYFPGAVKYDRMINRLSTDIVAICENVKNVLITRENVPASKIHIIHHGFVIEEFCDVSPERTERLRSKYKIDVLKRPVIGVISRYLELKGIQYIVPAFKKVLEKYPNALLILANAQGPYKEQVKALLGTLPDGSYTEISFENDIYTLYTLFDIFVHVPINEFCEAFGQIYIEALAAGVPSVFTISGVAEEFIENEKNALVVPYKDDKAIYDAIMKLLSDHGLSDFIKQKGMEDVKRYSIDATIVKLEKLYLSDN